MNSNFFDKKKQKILDLFKEKKYEDVIKAGEKLTKKKPDDTQLIYLLGLSFINTQNFLHAEKYFQKLLSLKKTHEIYYVYGNILKNLKKYSDAAISFEKANVVSLYELSISFAVSALSKLPTVIIL